MSAAARARARSGTGERMVRARGLEPPPLSGPDPKSGVSAIPPRALDLSLISYENVRYAELTSRQCCLVKRKASPSNSAGSKSRSRRHSYHKVLDNRKHPIHGLWRRNGKFLARVTVEAEDGRSSVHWVKLAAKSAAET